jgi:hypothetical protein
MTVAAPAWAPLCMDADEWAGWQRHNRRLVGLKGLQQADRPCADCPLGYAAEMRAIGRCNGQPGGIEEDEEEMTMEPTPIAVKKPPTASARIRVEAPCRTCSHAPVCRLRDAVIDAGEASIEVPALGDGVRIVLAGAVECDWYAKARQAPDPSKPRRELSPEQKEAARERMLRARAIGVEKKASAAAGG